MLFDLDGYKCPRIFTTMFAKTVRLALEFDQKGVSSYVQRIPCMMRIGPIFLRRGKDGTYAVPDLLGAIQGLDDTSLSRGVLFLK